jgi:hypothetical protein
MTPSPLPCGVAKHTPQGRPSPVKGEEEEWVLMSIFWNFFYSLIIQGSFSIVASKYKARGKRLKAESSKLKAISHKIKTLYDRKE